MRFLNQISDPDSIKIIPENSLPELCSEIREFLIDTILTHGGHFAGNLGVVELSVALHYVFDSPNDKIIWDVGHQSYVHKLITGRKNQISGIRHFSGLSGFPKIEESEHDIFGTGHSSTAISAASGIAFGQSLKGLSKLKTIAVVGDGALTGGMSFEALNNLAIQNTNVLVIINDNHIGIDPNNGAVDKHLQNINPNQNLFTNLGLPYYGPIDGHNINDLLTALKEISFIQSPAVLHIKTIKGKGYEPAENEQTKWHSAARFVKIATGSQKSNRKWQDVFADEMNLLAAKHGDIVGITPAMPSGSGMIKNMDTFPERFVDVGIAEQHAVTFAAGLSVAGTVPFLNIYSSFLQRGYDQLIHDVALQNLHVVFCIDRAGLVGEDGPTHHGAFDIAFLNPIPNIEILAPRNETELRKCMQYAYQRKCPVAIRYPKGDLPEIEIAASTSVSFTQAICLKKGLNIAIIATGVASYLAEQAIALSQFNVSLFHVLCIKPVPESSILEIIKSHSIILTVEDGCIQGGFGQKIASIALKNKIAVDIQHLGIEDQFVTHGENHILYEECGYGPQSIIRKLKEMITD